MQVFLKKSASSAEKKLDTIVNKNGEIWISRMTRKRQPKSANYTIHPISYFSANKSINSSVWAMNWVASSFQLG